MIIDRYVLVQNDAKKVAAEQYIPFIKMVKWSHILDYDMAVCVSMHYLWS